MHCSCVSYEIRFVICTLHIEVWYTTRKDVLGWALPSFSVCRRSYVQHTVSPVDGAMLSAPWLMLMIVISISRFVVCEVCASHTEVCFILQTLRFRALTVESWFFLLHAAGRCQWCAVWTWLWGFHSWYRACGVFCSVHAICMGCLLHKRPCLLLAWLWLCCSQATAREMTAFIVFLFAL